MAASVRAAVVAGALAGSAAFEYKSRYQCGVCQELWLGAPCERFGVCDEGNTSEAAAGCSSVCSTPADAAAPQLSIAGLELRVAKALGKKDYNLVRISAITDSAAPPSNGFFEYSAQFQHRWQDLYLHSTLKELKPGTDNHFSLGGKDVVLRLPAQGEGVSGFLLADPCVNAPSGKQWIGCEYGSKFNTFVNTPLLINTFAAGNHVDFWSISGDNFYDRTGEISTQVFNQISLDAKSKIFTSVPGNHDHWVMGSPEAGANVDQCGNGFMQFYGQDTMAAASATAGSAAAPFDFSVDPGSAASGCAKAAESNFLSYSQVGNLGIIGQDGAFSLDATEPFMKEACAWAAQQPGLDVLLLFGHWDVPGLGAPTDMAMPAWYSRMASTPGCDAFDKRGMLKFVMGHTHCNDVHPHGKVDTGFRVAGFGMSGCGNYGMPIVDTTEGRVRFWYFDTTSADALKKVVACVSKSGWRQCTALATKWLDQPIVKREQELVV